MGFQVTYSNKRYNKCNDNCSKRDDISQLVVNITGKSLSEAFLFAEYGESILCTKIVLNVRNNFCTQFVLPRFELGIFMYWTCSSMKNLWSYYGLVDAKIRASDKDLPVQNTFVMQNSKVSGQQMSKILCLHSSLTPYLSLLDFCKIKFEKSS